MLDGELRGEPKVHALTAEMLYGCDATKAKKEMINLQGQEVTAYYGGKRLRHGWHYGMKPPTMAQTFWISRKEAQRIDAVMTKEHPGIVQWWQDLGDEVFGVPEYRCPRDGTRVLRQKQDCPQCRGGMAWAGYARQPTNMLTTPMGRRRIYLGRRSQGMKAVIAQKPQGTGASMWYRTLMRLHGMDPAGGRWPTPPNTRIWGLEPSYMELTRHRDVYDTQVLTGTYDSFLLETDEELIPRVVQWLAWTMEQPWPQLGGLRIPADVEVGKNWGKRDERINSAGLDGYDYRPFSAQRPDGLG